MRNGRAAREDRRGVAAHPEESGAGEIDDAGIPELHVEAQAGEDDDEDAGQEEKSKVILAQRERDGQHRRRRQEALPHTRSLVRSPMRPLGRSAIKAITTPKANTSL